MSEETQIVRLMDPLPCGINQGEEPTSNCGRETPGEMIVLPICRQHAEAWAKVYENAD